MTDVWLTVKETITSPQGIWNIDIKASGCSSKLACFRISAVPPPHGWYCPTSKNQSIPYPSFPRGRLIHIGQASSGGVLQANDGNDIPRLVH